MATNCENKLEALKKVQTQSMNALFTYLSNGIAKDLYGKPIQWQRSKEAQKLLAKRIEDFQSKMYKFMEAEVRSSMNLANTCIDDKVKKYVEGIKVSQAQKEVLFARNLSAVSSFLTRKTNGLALSDRVWNLGQSTQLQINSFIEEGLLTGKSAVRNAKDLKQFLKEPDKTFRRIRDKETGKLVLSNPAKNYHPGQGVYRSSFKNALRLSRNETNMAYRHADLQRYRNLPFVTGYKVSLSNAHPQYDICDELQGEYPKNFTFGGWHPNCLCYITPIQINKKDFKTYLQTGKVSPDRYITQTPAGLGNWMKANGERVKGFKSLPYFIRDNFVPTKDGFKLAPGIGELGQILPKPLPKITPKPLPTPTPIPKAVAKKVVKKDVKNVQDPTFIAKRRKDEIEKALTFKQGKVDVDVKFYEMMRTEVKVEKIRGRSHASADTISLNFSNNGVPTSETANRLLVHELGHQIHQSRGWLRPMVGNSPIDPRIEAVFSKWKTKLSRLKANTNHPLEPWVNYQRKIGTREIDYWNMPRVDKDRISALADTIGSLTGGRQGWGHRISYHALNKQRYSMAEFVAHAFENKFVGNDFFKEMYPELYDDMIKLIDELAKD